MAGIQQCIVEVAKVLGNLGCSQCVIEPEVEKLLAGTIQGTLGQAQALLCFVEVTKLKFNMTHDEESQRRGVIQMLALIEHVRGGLVIT
jgi:hypothetical protein